jgi:hypothetical protein
MGGRREGRISEISQKKEWLREGRLYERWNTDWEKGDCMKEERLNVGRKNVCERDDSLR